jgi:hypothetical protein
VVQTASQKEPDSFNVAATCNLPNDVISCEFRVLSQSRSQNVDDLLPAAEANAVGEPAENIVYYVKQLLPPAATSEGVLLNEHAYSRSG